MAQQIIQTGAQANDKTGDPLRTAFTKVNQNFTELYTSSANTGDITFNGVSVIGDTTLLPQGSIQLVPNAGAIPVGQTHEGDLYTSWGQYIQIYPTWNADAPHIHITAGTGANSDGDLFIGDDWKYFQVNHTGDLSISTGGNTWSFLPDGTFNGPNGQPIKNKSVEVISSAGSWLVGSDVTITDSNAAGANITIILPVTPTTGQVVTVKNINAGGYSTIVQTNGTIVMENELGNVGASEVATLDATGDYITWIYDGSAFRIIG